MKPEWRTSAVVGMCESVRQSQDYSALPILADALEDAGCDDPAMLAALRGSPDLMTAQRLVAVAYSDESAAAVRAIEQIAYDLSPRALVEEGDGYGDEQDFTYERLMRAADRWFEGTKSPRGWGEYTVEHGSDNLQDQFSPAEFWPLYALVTGRPTAEMTDRFFSCTC
jgi:hypothetical protein